MRQVDDFFSEPAATTLYHYTGIGGVLGIVQTRTVWASHVYYLNDSMEILHACEVLREILAERVGNCAADEYEFINQFSGWLPTFELPFHLFVFSLSEERSLLSQWRSYTPHGKGVSLGFSPTVLNHFVQTSRFRLARCLYQRHEHAEVMNSLVDKMLTTFRKRLPTLDTGKDHPSQKYHSFLEKFRGDLLQVLAIVKHSAFREEREWRLVSP